MTILRNCLLASAVLLLVSTARASSAKEEGFSDLTIDQVSDLIAKKEADVFDNNSKDVRFLLAAGNAGIEAATNIVVKEANRQMLLLVYAAVTLLAFITFRSWRAVLCAILPLVLTSILCEALMVALGIYALSALVLARRVPTSGLPL